MKVNVLMVSMHGASDIESGAREVPVGTSVADLLTKLDLPKEDTYAVLVNDLPVSIDDRSRTQLSDGDRFTVFPPIKGG